MKITHFSGSMKLLTAIAGVGVAAALLYGSSSWWATVIDDKPAGTIATIDPGSGDAGRNASPGQAAAPQSSLNPTLAPSSRYQLHGVVAITTADGTGVALIAIDGGPARAYRVGAAVGGEFILLGVSPGGAILGPPMGPPVIVLEVVSGATAAGRTQSPGQGDLPAITSVEPPAPGVVAPPTQSAALASAGTQPGSFIAGDSLPVAADHLPPDTMSAAQAPSGKPSPGRRVRLQRLNSGP